MTDTVLILAGEEDTQARHVAQALTGRGAHPVLLDPARLATAARLSVTLRPDGARRLTAGVLDLDLDDLASVWFRRLGPPAPPQAGVSATLAGLWDGLGCTAVPARPVAVLRARYKLLQLLTAERAGLDVPATLVTTDPDECLRFYLENGGRIVSTELDGDVPPGAGHAPGPLLAQAYPERRLSVRVIVVGERVFAAEIHVAGSRRWVRPHRLPTGVGDACHDLVGRLDLCYGAVDLALTPDDRYIFAEVNPTGGYLLIEEATRLPITPALCDLLLRRQGEGGDLSPGAGPGSP
ncbi:ATP-grasp ribosomal peptide maturase [Microtetraspora sp. NBRC 13810]|uniref:ATP-grasp domain-containing protein n=1 Tax=Microtetraspora sp. NBRC 13810 TaxID=3030990 RepID=UPI0024A430F7|nr:hypothetical protein [Microtetraspora sp. NBRC 13810]GLW10788.1 ATP-grasp ribosomal peptide maturase [Microtetraspora sp. NBRC 13810]